MILNIFDDKKMKLSFANLQVTVYLPVSSTVSCNELGNDAIIESMTKHN